VKLGVKVGAVIDSVPENRVKETEPLDSLGDGVGAVPVAEAHVKEDESLGDPVTDDVDVIPLKLKDPVGVRESVSVGLWRVSGGQEPDRHSSHASLAAENAAPDCFVIIKVSEVHPGSSDLASGPFCPSMTVPLRVIPRIYTSEVPAPSPGAQPAVGHVTVTPSKTEILIGPNERQETGLAVGAVLVTETLDSVRAAEVKGIEPSADCGPSPTSVPVKLQA
jgi:hypothetical protein